MSREGKADLSSNRQRSVLVCQGTSCSSSKSERIRIALEEEIGQAGLDNVVVDFTGCHGFCQEGPIVIVKPEGILYTHVQVEDASEIVHSHLLEGKPVERLFYRDPSTNEPIGKYDDIDFFKKQRRLIMRNCGHINPERIDDAIAAGGYKALRKALFEMTPEQIINEVKASGLRGRGGGGFSTGHKWAVCRNTPSSQKYVICNDRNNMEGDPHTVIEGMIIAAYAVEAEEGYLVYRADSPLGLKRWKIALEQAEQSGFLGKNILGSGLNFRITIKEGTADFVCGEETALIATLEGERGMPRARPPYPAESGLWGKPTIVDNVRTLASIPVIINEGGEWFANIGTEKSKGTLVFSLTGKVANNGLVEVPMDTTLRELIFDIGGGIPKGKRFKAVQVGGPSGGFLTSSSLDSPLDWETLESAGSIMGSGVVVVLDEDSCIVDAAKLSLAYTQLESCGKCIPCRWGTKQMLDILEDITNGRGELGDIDLLLTLSEGVKTGALCGLGKTAPNPVVTSIRHFRDEYESHISKLHCPAAVCKGLVKAPCSHTCPAGVDVPRYLRLIAQEKYDEAIAVIRERIPFPSVCGYVCFHPCEAKCRRGQIDEPISIRALKRFAADHAQKHTSAQPTIAPSSGKRVAIVGSGPAGLTAAYYLAKLGGHAVTVFEALPETGGMMRVGIPRYRLPSDVLDNEIKTVREVGVEIRTNTRIESIDDLLEQGYDAVFLALGAHGGARLRVPGEDEKGVIECVTLLREVSLGKKVVLGKRVAVIGGGNAAMDAARTALRLGSKDVIMLYRRTQDEMPASPEEVEGALDEGVKMEFLVAPKQITHPNGHLKLECLRMALGSPDASGRRRPEPVPGSEFEEEFDTIIAAIGQVPQIPKNMGIATEKNGTLKADSDTLSTDTDGIFAGGDVVTGPASVIEAIAAGRQAAISIDRYLGGEGRIDEVLTAPEEPVAAVEETEEDDEHPRPKMPELVCSKRIKGFDTVELGYSEADALEEARRCLRCDLEDD